ncbi:NADP-dependent oxidoreductase (plasmid) [Streptomyces sp. BI20]|uniref:NADP-dependent oxidoreductase n=1 Tax=Streptomyces sp. BI20 TaxID=3403460 RepID=UPI003C768A1C
MPTPSVPSTPPTRTRAWHLVARPVGEPTPADFALRPLDLPPVGPGELLVRNTHFSVDPYMRGRMGTTPGHAYFPPYPLDEPLVGHALGEVLVSRSPDVAVGEHVVHFAGWREHAVVPADTVTRIEPGPVPLTAHLGVLGMTGLSAYVALFDIASFRPGDTVFVSGAAGAVGGQVGRMARLAGAARVIGSAGTDEKVRLLLEDGFDAAFNHRRGPVLDQLAQAAPKGVDVCVDTVGGAHLEAAIRVMNEHGRIALCGAISQYNDVEDAPGPSGLAQAIGKRLTLRGMIVTDHEDVLPRFVEEVGGWVGSGALRHRETFVDGIENGVGAFLGLFRGDNVGKTLVRL